MATILEDEFQSLYGHFDKRHGGPFDRGSADSYYQRPFDPHFYKGASGASERVGVDEMTEEEVVAYVGHGRSMVSNQRKLIARG